MEVGTQTKLTSRMINEIRPFSEEALAGNDEYVKFYTGLPNFGVLKAIYDFTASPNSSSSKLTAFQEFMLTLIKLRLDCPLKDLAYRFSISLATVSRIFSKWLSIMDTRISCLIMWPSRDSLWKTIP